MLCTPLAVQMFARSHALTPTETRVLEALCRGLDPRDVCAELEVDMTTVRSHISAIRTKVGADSVSEVVRRVAVLPPVVGVLKGTVS
jgi:DNA-binding NarL/FixJ family response regulator